MDRKSNKITGNRRKPIAKASSPTDRKVVLLRPHVVTMVNHFRSFQRKSAEAYVGLGETALNAAEKLSREDLREFCREVGLEFEGVQYRNLIKVGPERPSFTGSDRATPR